MTANQKIGQDAQEVFRTLLLGETVEESSALLVAPKGLQNSILEKIEAEGRKAEEGRGGYIGLKLNALTDKDIIDALIAASQKGVVIQLLIRGICCLIPGIPGKTENIRVHSIVGRFLEHSRIYRFGQGEEEEIYIASADFMTRNTLRRVEVAAPIYDERSYGRSLTWAFRIRKREKGFFPTASTMIPRVLERIASTLRIFSTERPTEIWSKKI